MAAIRVVCDWLVDGDDVAKWTQLFMTCKDNMERARPKLEEERRHKKAVLDYAFGRLSRGLDQLAENPPYYGHFARYVERMWLFVREVQESPMRSKLGAIPRIHELMDGAMRSLTRDIDEVTDSVTDDGSQLNVMFDVGRLSFVKFIGRDFKANVALRRVPRRP